jgi:flavocytochrome c
MEGISRRSFLAGATLATAGLGVAALSGCGPATPSGGASAGGLNPDEIVWDYEFDVVIAGAGGAGLAAAIEVYEAGASVIVLESQLWAGGSTAMNGGLMAGHGTRLAEKLGVTITTQQVLDWFDESAAAQTMLAGDPEPEILRIVGERGGQTIDWLVDQGVQFHETIGVEPDYCPMQVFHYTDNGGAFTTPLAEKLQAAGVQIKLRTRALKLYTDGEGRVIGLRADEEGRAKNFKARKAVVLATGGYASNEQLLEQMAPAWAGIFSCESPGALGDGLVMGAEIGAASRRMAMMPILIPALEMNSNLIFNWYCLEDGGVVVDSKAQRFVDEGEDYINGEVIRHALAHMKETGDENFWMIVHEGERTLQSLAIYPMDVARANSIEELAPLVDLNPTALAATVSAWNASVAAGEDKEFGRTLMMEPLDTPPFIAVKVRPSTAMVCGGLHTNAQAEVLKYAPLGSSDTLLPIPGLYAAGEATGWNARGGWSCNSCYTMGRIAGQNAAALESWE